MFLEFAANCIFKSLQIGTISQWTFAKLANTGQCQIIMATWTITISKGYKPTKKNNSEKPVVPLTMFKTTHLCIFFFNHHPKSLSGKPDFDLSFYSRLAGSVPIPKYTANLLHTDTLSSFKHFLPLNAYCETYLSLNCNLNDKSVCL